MDQQQPEIKQSIKSYPIKKYLRARKEAEIEELIVRISRISEDDYHLIRYELVKGMVESIITTQSGSITLQAIILKANTMLIRSIYYEISPKLNELLRQTYANYFCQCIYAKLDAESKHEFIVYIFANLGMILKNMISFRAAISILENPIPDGARKLAIGYLLKIDKKELLTHVRYIKTIETILPKLEDQEVESVIDMMTPIFKDLLSSKQGYFLIKKLVKKSAASNLLKGRVVTLIKKVGIAQFLSNNNGYLLIKCILKNFPKEAQSEETEIKEATNSLSECRMREISNQIENLLYKEDKEVKEESEQEDSASEAKDLLIENNCLDNSISANLSCPEDEAVIELFDLLVTDLVFCYSNYSWSKTLNKLHKKTVCFFLELRFGLFRRRLIKMLVDIESIQELAWIINSIATLYQDLSLIDNIISDEPHNSNIADLAEKLCLINPKELPEDLEKPWIDLISSNLRNDGKSELFNSILLINKDTTSNTLNTANSDNSLNFRSINNLSSPQSQSDVTDRKLTSASLLFNDAFENAIASEKSRIKSSANAPKLHPHPKILAQPINYNTYSTYAVKGNLKPIMPQTANMNNSNSQAFGLNFGSRNPLSNYPINNCLPTQFYSQTIQEHLAYQALFRQSFASMPKLCWNLNNVVIRSPNSYFP